MDIRKNHGELLLIENNLKKNINKKIKSNIKLQKGGTIVDNNNELYDVIIICLYGICNMYV